MVHDTAVVRELLGHVSEAPSAPPTPASDSPSGRPSIHPSTIEPAELQHLHRFWQEKIETLGHLPGRADFSPIELKSILPHIALVDVLRDGESVRCQFRLCGTGIAEGCGADLTGYSWTEDNVPVEVKKRTNALIERAEPYYSAKMRAVWAPNSFHTYSILALPLAKDGRTVDMILYGILFHLTKASLG